MLNQITAQRAPATNRQTIADIVHDVPSDGGSVVGNFCTATQNIAQRMRALQNRIQSFGERHYGNDTPITGPRANDTPGPKSFPNTPLYNMAAELITLSDLVDEMEISFARIQNI